MEEGQEYKHNPHHVFGSPLELVRIRDSVDIPKILTDGVEYFRRQFTLMIPFFESDTSTFDVKGENDEIALLKSLYNSGSPVEAHKLIKNPFSFVSIFREFLRSLPDSIISSKFFQAFFSISELPHTNERLHQLVVLLSRTEAPAKNILLFLLAFFFDIHRLSLRFKKKATAGLAEVVSLFVDSDSLIRPPKGTPYTPEIQKKCNNLLFEMITHNKHFT